MCKNRVVLFGFIGQFPVYQWCAPMGLSKDVGGA